jgi:hypothetical protein
MSAGIGLVDFIFYAFMKRFFSGWIVLMVMFSSPLVAQKPVAQEAILLFHNKQVQTYDLFGPSVEAKEQWQEYVRGARSFTLRKGVLNEITSADQHMISIALPAPSDLVLDLYRTQVFSEGATIKTSDGREFTPDPHHFFYRGIIHDHPNSLAIVSIWKDVIHILISDEFGNRRIQPTADGNYILFF